MSWLDSNQQYLSAELARIRGALERHLAGATSPESEPKASFDSVEPPAVVSLQRALRLTEFEADVLMLCAGVELDSNIAALCAKAHGDPRRTAPSFGLALAALSNAHWSAIVPSGPLRRWRLLELASTANIAGAALRIDERALHFLVGVPYLDSRLSGLIEPAAVPSSVPHFQAMLAQKIASSESSVIQIGGDDAGDTRTIAAFACNLQGRAMFSLRASDIPAAFAEREALARLWERESLLTGAVLYVEHDSSNHVRAIESLVETVEGRFIVAGSEPLVLQNRRVKRFEWDRPGVADQAELWRETTREYGISLNGTLDSLISQFSLTSNGIRSACAAAAGAKDAAGALWNACRAQSRSRLEGLAERVAATASWNDLVLPENQRTTLRTIALQVRNRAKVYHSWGFAGKGTRGLGISALFAGPSGTGKTMAAEVLANDLNLDLYRIDLSQVVSKYIGETEKNLRRIFDAAEECGAILLFDEADALFGKRSEVRDSHDRYANIEISYLLQRMESYRGLAILTTNMKHTLDAAFLRRIRFAVTFPFPDASLRAAIWQQIFPSSTPTEGLDVRKLARLNVAGGNIRNIALHAAFFAADENQPVRMGHVLKAARSEYTKLEKQLSAAESRDWI